MKVRSGLNKGLKWIAGSSTHGCWIGTYEQDKQAILQEFIQPGMNVFDIGANAGFYTLAFSRLTGSRGHVWAFEPLAENAFNILRHLQLNRIHNVTLLQAAASDKSGLIGFRIFESNSMGRISREIQEYQIPTISIDELVLVHGIPAPEVIKMDVEGAESLVLAGARQTLARARPIIFIALHGDDQARQCREILESSGYDIHLLSGEKVTGMPIRSDEIYAVPKSK
jgi:FkbM family methyltransferase